MRIAGCGLRIHQSRTAGRRRAMSAERWGADPQSTIRYRILSRRRRLDLGGARLSTGEAAWPVGPRQLAVDCAGAGLRRGELRLSGRALAVAAEARRRGNDAAIHASDLRGAL